MSPIILGLGSSLSESSVDVRTQDIIWGFDNNSSYNTSGTTFVYSPHATRGTYASWRFLLNIPKGATIVSASFTLYGHDAGTNWNNMQSDMVVGAVQADNASSAGSGTTAISDLGNLGITKVWMPSGSNGMGAPGAGGAITAGVDLASVIQQVVNRAGWVSGNGLVLMSHTQGASGTDVGCSGVGSVEVRRPRLQVTYLS